MPRRIALLLLLALPVLAIVGTVGVAQSRPRGIPAHLPQDALTRFGFQVFVDGEDMGIFKSVDGLGIEVEVEEFVTGTDPLVRKRPGRVKYGDITLKKGYVSTTVLNDWIEQARLGSGAFTRKNMSIVLFDQSNPAAPVEVKRWNLFETFPKSWKMSSLDGKGNDILTEEVVVVIEWFEEG